jgi:hypothetical protein
LWGAGDDRSIKPNNEAAARLLAENGRARKKTYWPASSGELWSKDQLKEFTNASNADIATDRGVPLSGPPAP